MAGGKLTDKAIKNAKTGERLTILSDGGGLQLWLTPAGGKLWHYAYRFGAKRRKLAIGPYGKEPAGIPLEAARRRRDEAAAVSLEVGVPIVKDYPVYDFKTQLRVNVIY
jgi:hypothetical protein